MRARWFAAFALLFIAAGALFAQQSGRQYVIAVSVDSTDSRIQQMIPELRQKAALAIEQSAKNVSATVVMGSPLDAAEQARQKSADYLITIDLSLLSQLGSRAGIGRGPASTADVPVGGVPTGIAHSRCQDLINEAFAYSFKVTAMSAEKIKVQGSHTMQESEYPLGPEYNCLGKFSTQAVRLSAADAVKGLKSKKKI